MMRLNEWTPSGPYDPTSETNPIYPSPKDAVASRFDLDPNSPENFGEIDAKIANIEMLERNECLAINGPSY